MNYADFSGNASAGIPPDDEATWRGILQTYIDSFANIVCTLDGIPVTFNPNTPIVRTQSPTFSVTLGLENILGAPPGTYEDCWSDGYWVMLPDLSSGEHILHFSCTSSAGSSASGFSQDVTYIINRPVPLPSTVLLLGSGLAGLGLLRRKWGWKA